MWRLGPIGFFARYSAPSSLEARLLTCLRALALLFALALLAPNLWGCDDAPSSADATDTVDSSLPIDLTPAELDTRLAAGPVLLLNVHVPYEGEIVGTTAHVPYDDLPALSAAIGAFDRIFRALLGTEVARFEPPRVPTRDRRMRVVAAGSLSARDKVFDTMASHGSWLGVCC